MHSHEHGPETHGHLEDIHIQRQTVVDLSIVITDLTLELDSEKNRRRHAESVIQSLQEANAALKIALYEATQDTQGGVE